MNTRSISAQKSRSDLCGRFGSHSMRSLFTVLTFALFFVFPGIQAQAQYAIGISAIAANPQTIDTYSATELDPVANYYYDPYVEGYLFRKYFTSLSYEQIRSGAAYGGSDYIAYGYMSAPTEIRSRYRIESDHYVVAYYYVYEPCCGYYYYNPGGYGFASNDGSWWPSGYNFLPGTAPTYVQAQYLYLGTTGVDIPVSPPAVEAIAPAGAVRGTGGSLATYGSYLYGTYQAQVSGGGATLTPTYVSEPQVNLSYNIALNASTGLRQLTLTNPFGTGNPEDFTIGDPTPVIANVTPTIWEAGTSVDIVINGTGFGTNPLVEVSGGGVTAQITTAGDTQIRATLTIAPGASGGARGLTVISRGYGGNPFIPAPGTNVRPNSDPAACQVVQPSLTVSALSAILKGNSGTINVTLTSIANQKARLTLKTKTGTSGEVRFADDNSTTKEVSVGTTTLGIKGVTESSEVDNLYLEAKVAGVTKEEYFTVVILKLKQVAYSGSGYHQVSSDRFDPYAPPHWQDNSTPLNGTADDPADRKLPVAFVRNSRMQISAKWLPVPAASLDGLTVKVKGTGFTPGPVTVIPETTATVSSGEVNITSADASILLPNNVNYLPTYSIDWEVMSDLSWIQSGISSNKVYTLLGPPPPPATGFILQQTFLDIGCKNAAGLTDQIAILNAVWAEFSDREVIRRRYDLQQNVLSEKKLTYYASYRADIVDANTLLFDDGGDGQCGSWATLFGLTLRAIGVTLPINYIKFETLPTSLAPLPTTMDRGMFVKNWSFTSTPSSPVPEFPYRNLTRATVDYTLETSYNFLTPADVSDSPGIPGQSVANPASIFNNHQFLQIDGKYYDASYGVIYTSPEDCHAKAVDALWAEYVVPLDEPVVDRDLNGDGDKTDLAVDTVVDYIKRSPPPSSFVFRVSIFP